VLTILLIKGLLAAVIVGFVTASIQSWVDRFFLVILLITLIGLPIQEAITVNLIVVSLAALMMALRQSEVLRSVREEWPVVVLPALVGAVAGRVSGLWLPPQVLTLLLGIYAILAGLRLAFIRTIPARESPLHPAWITPVTFTAGLLTGLLSAGAKVFQVPLLNMALGHHPKKAYALAALGVSTGAPAALAVQIGLGQFLQPDQVLLALYLFVLIVSVALIVHRFWSMKLTQWVSWIVAPILVLIGVRFLLAVFA